mmetsp:Transcript_6282/g.8843  ORF Transcript_6282/g.8843 Transcript_6282/m.8843 type:complete len:203 (+) Transcript_6282:213-821(+)
MLLGIGQEAMANGVCVVVFALWNGYVESERCWTLRRSPEKPLEATSGFVNEACLKNAGACCCRCWPKPRFAACAIAEAEIRRGDADAFPGSASAFSSVQRTTLFHTSLKKNGLSWQKFAQSVFQTLSSAETKLRFGETEESFSRIVSSGKFSLDESISRWSPFLRLQSFLQVFQALICLLTAAVPLSFDRTRRMQMLVTSFA